MLPLLDVNITAVLAAAVVSFFAGMIWYSPPVFGTIWMKYAKPKDGSMVRAFTLAICSTLIGAYALAVLLLLTAPLTMTEAMAHGVLFLLALALPLHSNALGWENRPLPLVAINAGWTVVGTLLMVGVLQWWPW